MPKPPLSQRELIDRIDARHEALIHRLDELNAQIERALADVYRQRAAAEKKEASAASERPAMRRAA